MNQISLGGWANFNSAVPWGIWVVVYTWLLGISAGGFFAAVWCMLSNNQYLKKITHAGIILSTSALLIGLLSILIDLGHIERFYKLFISPHFGSAMAWEVWLYGAYGIFLAIFIFARKKKMPKAFLQFSIIFALAILLVESLLFAMPPGRHWHSVVFPLHFITSSLVSGVAALILASAFVVKNDKDNTLKALAKIALLFVAVNLAVEIIAKENPIFLLTSIITIVLLLVPKAISITAAGSIQLINVFMSKYISIISAQAIEPYKGFENAYIEPRLAFAYSPTVFELSSSVFLMGLTIALFYFLYKILPLTRGE